MAIIRVWHTSSSHTPIGQCRYTQQKAISCKYILADMYVCTYVHDWVNGNYKSVTPWVWTRWWTSMIRLGYISQFVSSECKRTAHTHAQVHTHTHTHTHTVIHTDTRMCTHTHLSTRCSHQNRALPLSQSDQTLMPWSMVHPEMVLRTCRGRGRGRGQGHQRRWS